MDPQQYPYVFIALILVIVVGVVSFMLFNTKKVVKTEKAKKASSSSSSSSGAAEVKSSATASTPAPAAAVNAAPVDAEAAKKKKKKRSKSKASNKGQTIAPVGQMDDSPDSEEDEELPPVKPAPAVVQKPKKTAEEKAVEELIKIDDKKNKEKKKQETKKAAKSPVVVGKMEDAPSEDSDGGEEAFFINSRSKAAVNADGWAVVEKRRNKKVDAAPQAASTNETTSSTATASAVEEAAPAVAVEVAAPAPAPVPEPQTTAEETEDEEEKVIVPPEPVVEKVTQELTVEAKRLGLLIGVKGATRIAIQSATDTNIQMPKTEKDSTADVTISVTGEEAGVAKALVAMKELLKKGYCMLLAEPDFRESDVTVHPRFLPDIIGKKGSVIKALGDHTGVRINVPELAAKTPGPDGKVSKIKIGLAGLKDKVALCRNLIKEITRFHHTEITHPGVVHEELILDAKYYNFIIGAKGTEIKNIQNSHKVSVHIPDAESLCPNVLIVGEPEGVAAAKRHIEKIVEKVNERLNPKPKEETTTSCGDVSPSADAAVTEDNGEESWMKEIGPASAATAAATASVADLDGSAFPATLSAPIGLTKSDNAKPAWNASKNW